jgi:hypothetical protein
MEIIDIVGNVTEQVQIIILAAHMTEPAKEAKVIDQVVTMEQNSYLQYF